MLSYSNWMLTGAILLMLDLVVFSSALLILLVTCGQFCIMATESIKNPQ